MALKTMMLRKQLDSKRGELAALRKRAAGMAAREAELEKAVGEAQTGEEQKTVEEAVAQFEEEQEQLAAQMEELAGKVQELEEQLAALEESPAAPPSGKEERSVSRMARKNYRALAQEERARLVHREDVKEFLEGVRSLGRGQRRASGMELTVPQTLLPMLTDAIERYSKLMKHVQVQPVRGTARATVLGVVPEAVWTEQGGKVSELALDITGADVDGYKVAGYIPLPNWVLEDSDEDLLALVLDTLGKSLGLGVDKAILYGTGNKMPLGIVTRLAQTAKPAGGPHEDAVAWKDLHASHVKSIAAAKNGVALFQELLKASGAAKANYSDGEKFWAMNEATLNTLKVEGLSVNAAGAIVTGMSGEMPVIGGQVETLPFIPDNVIVGGYGSLYLLAERGGAKLATSEHVRFLEDQTVAKGVARYDGQPLIPESFVAVGLAGTAVSASDVQFAGTETETE